MVVKKLGGQCKIYIIVAEVGGQTDIVVSAVVVRGLGGQTNIVVSAVVVREVDGQSQMYAIVAQYN